MATTATKATRKAPVAKSVELMKLETKRTWSKNGVERDLKDPDGYASEGQVMALYKRGLLVIAATPVKTPFTKGQASYVMDVTSR